MASAKRGERLSVGNPQVIVCAMLAKIQTRCDRDTDCFQQHLREAETVVRQCAAICIM